MKKRNMRQIIERRLHTESSRSNVPLRRLCTTQQGGVSPRIKRYVTAFSCLFRGVLEGAEPYHPSCTTDAIITCPTYKAEVEMQAALDPMILSLPHYLSRDSDLLMYRW